MGRRDLQLSELGGTVCGNLGFSQRQRAIKHVVIAQQGRDNVDAGARPTGDLAMQFRD